MLTRRRKTIYLGLATLVAVVLMVPGASFYYERSAGKACTSCHEIWQTYTDWHTSTHRSVECTACHGNVFTLEAGFHINNIRRLVTHLRGTVPERVRIRDKEVEPITARCQKCHQQEFADWQAGPHGSTFTKFFLDQKHNREKLLMDDCLRCHGSTFDGPMRDLVTPLDTKGPWRFKRPAIADRPAMPCLACHQIHHEGSPLVRPPVKPENPGPIQEINRPSLALFDRRELEHVSLARLSLPAMHEGARVVKISPDRRQALCYQCHAPIATMQVGSGGDRTPIGVHEGLSCFACHHQHGQQTRASCATCHPQLSNCGLDVEKMDTTFKSTASKHNVHFVKCIDCHTKGVPKKKVKV